MPLSFHKMHGAGNDFILLDHRSPVVPNHQKPAFVQQLCARHTGIGADGVIFIEPDSAHDFAWDFFNADGSAAEMCGNGARCAARFALSLGIAASAMTFRTRIGTIDAVCLSAGDQVRIHLPDVMPPVRLPALSLPDDLATSAALYFVNTGVPHVVMVCAADIVDLPLLTIGAALRHHPDFAPAGTNVNLMQSVDAGGIAIRTFERGVEGETLACGTGALACALVAAAHYGLSSPLAVRVQGGDTLTTGFTISTDTVTAVTLTGPAVLVYTGVLTASLP